MDVVPSLTICEIQDGVYSKQREGQTQKERTQGWGGCAAPWAEVATLCWGHREGLWALQAPSKLGSRSCFHCFWQRHCWWSPWISYVLFLMWERWLKRFQVFLAPENAQEGFWCAGCLPVICALHLGSVLQHHTPGTAWPPHRDSRITPITWGFAAKVPGGSRNALCSHCFSLWFS